MTRLLYLGSTLLAILAHALCCLVPLLTAVLGMGGFLTPLNWLLQNQGWVLAGQMMLLSYSFYHVYGPGNQRHRCWEKGALWLAAGVVVGVAVLSHSGVLRSEESRLAREQMQRVRDTRWLTFVVKTPARGAKTLHDELGALPGIVPTQTKICGELVSVRYRSAQTTRSKVLSALRQKGYVVYEKPVESLFLTETNLHSQP